MVDQFITWDMLKAFGQLAMLVWMFVEYTKELKPVKDIKTKYYAGIVAFSFIIITQIVTMILDSVVFMEMFKILSLNMLLYILSAIAITFTTNGMSDFNNRVDKTTKE